MSEGLQIGALAALLGGLALSSLVVAAVTARMRARAAGARSRTAIVAPLFETARLLRQRPRRTVSADRMLWRLASSAFLPLAIVMAAFVPLPDRAVVSHPLSVVWVNALDVVAWALWWLLGWGANSIAGLVGGYRFLALALGFELPLMFALTAPVVAAGSLDLAEITVAQNTVWFVAWMPLAFLAYCWAVLGFSVRAPMGAPAGTDISGGVLAELAGVDRLLVLAGRYALVVAGSGVAVTLFLGGGTGPVLPAWLWLAIKTLGLAVLLCVSGSWIPTLRPDKLLEVGWLVALPLVIGQLLVVALIVVLT